MQTQKKVEEKEIPNTYRYVCHGCTNDALVSSNTMVGVSISCKHCSLTQTTKAENYIAL